MNNSVAPVPQKESVEIISRVSEIEIEVMEEHVLNANFAVLTTLYDLIPLIAKLGILSFPEILFPITGALAY